MDSIVEVVEAVPAGDLVDLYTSVGWSSYSEDPERLAAAIAGSSFVAIVRYGDQLVGLVRGVSDNVSILYVQDLLVDPVHQGKGIGRLLLSSIVHRYAHVRQKVLLTDDEDRQHRLYSSFGFHDVVDVDRLHAFVRIDDGELEI
jgi:GNAT superfamily N-acetyltransferase